MVKLSELKEDEMLLVNERVMTTEELLNQLIEDKESGAKLPEVYTTRKHTAILDAEDILDNAIENEYANMYEDWYDSIKGDITSDDVAEIQSVLDRILARNKDCNISYEGIGPVELDILDEYNA